MAVVARGLFKVAASGGSLEAIGENLRAAWPSFLPDGFWQGRTMMAARIDDALRPAPPQAPFPGLYTGAGSAPGFDVAPDGRFLVVLSDPRSALDRVTVLQHWTPPVRTQ